MAWDLKSEEEVKEYLENLRTEYSFGCYSEQKAEGEYIYFFKQLYVILFN